MDQRPGALPESGFVTKYQTAAGLEAMEKQVDKIVRNKRRK